MDSVDLMIDDYVNWREACAEVASAYQRWSVAARRDEALTFSAYLAALDREERAASAYQQAITRVTVRCARAVTPHRAPGRREISSADAPPDWEVVRPRDHRRKHRS